MHYTNFHCFVVDDDDVLAVDLKSIHNWESAVYLINFLFTSEAHTQLCTPQHDAH